MSELSDLKETIRVRLAAVVTAKAVFWDKLRELEEAVTKSGDFSDEANNDVVDQIDLIAAGMIDSDASDVVELAHVDDLLAIVARWPS